MKLNKFANLLVIGLVLTVAASGCRKKPINLTNLPGPRTGPVQDPGFGNGLGPAPRITPGPDVTSGPGGPGDAHASNASGPHDLWLTDAEALKAETVYFEFDSSVLKAAEKSKVAAVADYLKANSAKAVKIEGNC